MGNDPDGIDVAALKEIKEVNRARLTEYKKYRPNSEYHEGRAYGLSKLTLLFRVQLRTNCFLTMRKCSLRTDAR